MIRAAPPVALAIGLVSAAQAALPDAGRELAERYGIEAWDRVTRVEFTFQFHSAEYQASREWVWEPKEDRVTYHGMDGRGGRMSATYRRGSVGPNSSAATHRVDEWFEHDSTWLFFPLKVAWTPGVAVTEDGRRALPLGHGEAKRLTVAFPPGPGGAPGDVYELYLDGRGLIRQWNRRPGGRSDVRPMTWSGYHRVGPLVLSLAHQGRGGESALWFSRVSVVMDGEQQFPVAMGDGRD